MATAELSTADRKTFSTEAVELFDRLRGIVKDMVQFARDYAAAVKRRPDLRDEVATLGERTGHTAAFWRRLEMVGNGAWHPQLLYERDARLAKLSLDQQQALLVEGVEVADADCSGSHRLLTWEQMLPEQRKQVLGDGIMRDIRHQVVFLKNSAKPERRADPASIPYRWEKGYLVFTAGAKFSKRELLAILAENA
jgi:hypothetical protein